MVDPHEDWLGPARQPGQLVVVGLMREAVLELALFLLDGVPTVDDSGDAERTRHSPIVTPGCPSRCLSRGDPGDDRREQCAGHGDEPTATKVRLTAACSPRHEANRWMQDGQADATREPRGTRRRGGPVRGRASVTSSSAERMSWARRAIVPPSKRRNAGERSPAGHDEPSREHEDADRDAPDTTTRTSGPGSRSPRCERTER